MNAVVQAQPAPSVPSTVVTPVNLLALAYDKGAPIEQLERLMALKREYEKDEARKAYYAATAAMRTEPIVIVKGKHVHFKTKDRDGNYTGKVDYWHAELADVCAALDPALARHGLSYRWDVNQAQGRVAVTCYLRHALGHEETLTMDGPPDDSGKKNPMQQIQSTVTYLQRHTLLGITGSSTRGMDNDGRGSDDDDDDGAGDGAANPADTALLQQGRDASMQGMAALTAWWGALSAKQRSKFNGEFGGLRKAAQEADRRSVGAQ